MTHAADPGFLSATPVTRGPKHHFFGYYDKCPWDQTGRYLLASEIDFVHRQPEPGEPVTVGMVDLQEQNRYVPLDTTIAWGWQQGTMLQWLGSAPDREIIYNGFDDGKYLSVIRDIHDGKARRLPLPVYAISRDGKQAVSLDFDRVNRLRPGYGYMAMPERHPDESAPADAGIYWMDLDSGVHRLIVSLEWASRDRPDETFSEAHHWFNHLQFNPSATRFLFLHRWRPPDQEQTRRTRLYTSNPDGSDIRLLSDTGMVSHFDWRDDHTILAWTRTNEQGDHFYLLDDQAGTAEVIGGGVLDQDGHCSYSPDRKWILNDTYPDTDRMQTLMLYRVSDRRRFDVGRFYLPPDLSGPFRCDLHPRWNRDGTQVCIDSAHESGRDHRSRQMYVVDVSQITRA